MSARLAVSLRTRIPRTWTFVPRIWRASSCARTNLRYGQLRRNRAVYVAYIARHLPCRKKLTCWRIVALGVEALGAEAAGATSARAKTATTTRTAMGAPIRRERPQPNRLLRQCREAGVVADRFQVFVLRDVLLGALVELDRLAQVLERLVGAAGPGGEAAEVEVADDAVGLCLDEHLLLLDGLLVVTGAVGGEGVGSLRRLRLVGLAGRRADHQDRRPLLLRDGAAPRRRPDEDE